ncbi:helix-hairpin-helix motif protein [bacterium BMS3Bbin14]|nr:helix-hairpin-helix motif protein [bacterium BMS3Abin13]GBE52020.1 helix-hairpin-helix motif protein [bacterium BMS3Bbin14]
MNPVRPEAGKDKQLLVLLALGVLILGSHLYAQPFARETVKKYCWLQIAGTGLYRVPLSPEKQDSGRLLQSLRGREVRPEILARLQPGRVIALRLDKKGRLQPARLSPRPAFLLGLPFPINRADVDELTLLSGIGPHLAGRIAAFRHRHGPFRDEKMLTSVSGIGPRLASRLAPLLSFD